MSYLVALEKMGAEREKEIQSLKQDKARLLECVKDFVLEQDHEDSCAYKSSNDECGCMDRAYFNYEDCLSRAEKILKDLEEE